MQLIWHGPQNEYSESDAGHQCCRPSLAVNLSLPWNELQRPIACAGARLDIVLPAVPGTHVLRMLPIGQAKPGPSCARPFWVHAGLAESSAAEAE
jgi:hypothetical protein